MKEILLSLALAGLAAGSDGDWCWTIPQDVGVLVDDPDATWLQSLKLGGYAHFHSAFVDGRAGGRDFWYGRGADWRRARVTLNAKLLDSVSLLVHTNVVDDEGRTGGGAEWDYNGLFLAWAELDLKKLAPAVPLESWGIAYGKRKLKELNEEMDTSINAIVTVERSSFAAQLVPFRAGTGTTGVWTTGTFGNNEFTVGLYSTDASPEFGNWADGTLVVGGWKYDFSEQMGVDEATLSIGGGMQDIERGDEVYSQWEWVFTPWFRYRNGCWQFRASAAYGENEGAANITGGSFAGFTLMPSYWLVKDRLLGVLRYQFVKSEAPRGVQLTARYAREAGRPQNEAIPGLFSGRGDELQSVYAGLLWNICPKRWTMLAGAEWEQLESRDLEVYQGVTGWFATRLIF